MRYHMLLEEWMRSWDVDQPRQCEVVFRTNYHKHLLSKFLNGCFNLFFFGCVVWDPLEIIHIDQPRDRLFNNIEMFGVPFPGKGMAQVQTLCLQWIFENLKHKSSQTFDFLSIVVRFISNSGLDDALACCFVLELPVVTDVPEEVDPCICLASLSRLCLLLSGSKLGT